MIKNAVAIALVNIANSSSCQRVGSSMYCN